MHLQTTTSPESNRLTRFADLVGSLIPDAMSTSVVLLVIVFLGALALGNSPGATLDAYYRGLWMLLPFTMQMTLILALSCCLGAAPFFRRLVGTLSRLPRTPGAVLGLVILLQAALSYCYWGLGIALGPVIAVSFAHQAEKKGVAVDFPFLLATTIAAQSVWQFGFSASAPLLMNTPGHFLEKTTGIMPLRTTIFAPATFLFLGAFLVTVYVAARVLLPRNPRLISEFPESRHLGEMSSERVSGEAEENQPGDTFSKRVERNPLPTVILATALVAWLAYHFGHKNGGLELNSLNTILLLLCLATHRNVRDFSKALPGAVAAAWPVVVLYHVYAGVAGLIQFTNVGDRLGEFFASVSNHLTFPLLTALSSSVVSIFVPSSGGQWVIQGLITAKTASAIGVTTQRGLLALSIGDHMGNLLSPFWVVIAAGIARIDFRQFIGYNLVFAALWFGLGVLCFTFLPV